MASCEYWPPMPMPGKPGMPIPMPAPPAPLITLPPLPTPRPKPPIIEPRDGKFANGSFSSDASPPRSDSCASPSGMKPLGSFRSRPICIALSASAR